MEFMNRIDKLIAEKGITRNILAKEVEGLNHNSFNAWVKRGTIPNGEVIANIAKYFGVTTDFLLGQTDQKEKPVHNDEDEPGRDLVVVHRNGQKIVYHITEEKLKALEPLLKELDAKDAPDL